MIYPIVRKETNKTETRFFSRMCQEANAMFIILFRPFLAGLELTLHRHMLSQKNRLDYAISCDFEILRTVG